MKRIIVLALLLMTYNLYSFDKFVDPNPSKRNSFGSQICTLPSGNVVITAPCFVKDSNTIGAVYLFSGKTGELISALYGTNNAYITILKNGNFVVASPLYSNGTLKEIGAITLVDGIKGMNGAIDNTNSLIGANSYDRIGLRVKTLATGNLIFYSPYFKNKNLDTIGALTFFDITKPVTGILDKSNSLIGNSKFALLEKLKIYSSYTDNVFGCSIDMSNVYTLSNGGYLIRGILQTSKYKDSLSFFAYGLPNSGIAGEINELNSITFANCNSPVNADFNIYEIGNSNFLIKDNKWVSSDGKSNGRITWCDASKYLSGNVDSTNSFIGIGDAAQVKVLPNGNYLIKNNNSVDKPISNKLIFLGDYKKKISGSISESNSLYCGSNAYFVGNIENDLTILPNGSFIVVSKIYDNALKGYPCVFTKSDGYQPLIGRIDTTNSFFSSNLEYSFLNILKNGDFIITNSKTLTYRYADKELKGKVSKTNSIVERFDGELKNLNFVQLLNNEFIVYSNSWKSQFGILTKYNKPENLIGTIDSSNSLIIENFNSSNKNLYVRSLNNGNYTIETSRFILIKKPEDTLKEIINYMTLRTITGTIFTFKNGNFLLLNPMFKYNDKNNAGAVTFCDGTKALPTGIDSSNSIFGVNENDYIGAWHIPAQKGQSEYIFSKVEELDNGNFVIFSPNYQNSQKQEIGAITIGNTNTGISGMVNSQTSLIGCGRELTRLNNGNLLVSSANSISWINISNPVKGEVSNKNSLISLSNDRNDPINPVKSIYEISNGNFILKLDNFKGNSSQHIGCFSFGDNTKGITGYISDYNSLIPSDDGINNVYQFNKLVLDSINKLIYISFPSEDFVRVIGFENTLEVKNEVISSNFALYPNPCSTYFKGDINLTEYSNVAVEIYTPDGRIVKRNDLGYFPAGKSSVNVNVQDLPAGSYVVKITNNNNVFLNILNIIR